MAKYRVRPAVVFWSDLGVKSSPPDRTSAIASGVAGLVYFALVLAVIISWMKVQSTAVDGASVHENILFRDQRGEFSKVFASSRFS